MLTESPAWPSRDAWGRGPLKDEYSDETNSRKGLAQQPRPMETQADVARAYHARGTQDEPQDRSGGLRDYGSTEILPVATAMLSPARDTWKAVWSLCKIQSVTMGRLCRERAHPRGRQPSLSSRTSALLLPEGSGVSSMDSSYHRVPQKGFQQANVEGKRSKASQDTGQDLPLERPTGDAKNSG